MTETYTLVVSQTDLRPFEQVIEEFPEIIAVHRSPLCPPSHVYLVPESRLQYRMQEVLALYEPR
jgi:hypothetical protein